VSAPHPTPSHTNPCNDHDDGDFNDRFDDAELASEHLMRLITMMMPVIN
jgi:hypothetical protein